MCCAGSCNFSLPIISIISGYLICPLVFYRCRVAREARGWGEKKKEKKKKLGPITFVSFTRSNRSSKIVMTVTVEFYVSFKNVISWLRILRATGKRGK